MGLRELKKTRTRQAVRQAAIRLFYDQGYDATTVEQIAACAEISTATFYRYYCDKEDVVLSSGDNDGLYEEVLVGRPEREPVFDTIRALYEHIASDVEGDAETMIDRLTLIFNTPSLQARRWVIRQGLINRLATLLAPRAGASADDHDLRLAITILLAAEAEILSYWARTSGSEPLADLFRDGLAKIEPAFAIWPGSPDLERPAPPPETRRAGPGARTARARRAG